jgi:hypothetical protein
MLGSVPKTQLALLFGVSLPTLRRYAAGEEPNSIAIIDHINAEIAKATKKRKPKP